MWSMATARRGRMAAVCAAVVLGVSVAAWAQQLTYEGDVIGVDSNARTFTVKGSKPGEVLEMKFHVASTSAIVMEGRPSLFGELIKGDHVTVSYGSVGATHTVHRAERIRSVSREMTFAGDVIAVDVKAQTFTVKNATGRKVEEMTFHVNPTARLYIGGEGVLLAQVHTGDIVTVVYDSTGPSPYAKHVRKGA